MKRSREEINKSKLERFKKLAEARTQKTIDMIQLIGNLSNTSNYEYTDEQVEKIFRAIQYELDNAHNKFKNQKNPDEKFKL